MTNARNNILNRLQKVDDKEDLPTALPTTPNPKNLIGEFISQLELNAATVIRTTPSKLIDAVGNFFVSQKLSKTVLTGLDLGLDQHGFEVLNKAATGNEEVGLSQAVLGISETGTLVLASSSSNPTSINYLVDHHLVLVNERDVVCDLATAINLFQKRIDDPRAINLISGPSRTADIEQTIQLGAHGPRNLVVLLISSE